MTDNPSAEPSGGSEDDSAQRSGAFRELSGFLQTHEHRHRLLPRALVVGFLVGVAAILFRLLLEGAQVVRNRLIDYSYAFHGPGILLSIAFSATGAALAVLLVRKLAPETSGSGIPQVEAVLHRLSPLRWRRILPIKFLGGGVAIGTGMALGREGPTIHLGAAIAQMVTQFLPCRPRERMSLVAAGAGAGLAAAFNAPLAGLLFVMEELQRERSPGIFFSTFIAAVSASVVSRFLLGQGPMFHIPSPPTPPLSTLPSFIVLGALAGMLGVAYNQGLVASLRFFHRLKTRFMWLPAAAVGVLVGITGWFSPGWVGDGHTLAQATLQHAAPVASLAIMFVVRFTLTMLCYGCGAPGGIFAPLLVLGAAMGQAVGVLAQYFPWQGLPYPDAFGVVGMAAYFTAIVRAPVTGIVLIVEMTENYSLMLPLLVASLVAYAVADLVGDQPIYEALLEMDLKRSQSQAELEGALVVELPVHEGSAFDGLEVRQLGLPPGVIIVTVRRGMHEIVPTATTRLEGGDWIIAVVGTQAADAVGMLRAGTEVEEEPGLIEES